MPSIKTTPTLQCKVCFKHFIPSNLHELFFKHICICQKCLEEYSPKIRPLKIDKVRGLYLYTYNDKIREKIYTFKGCGDIELSSTFLSYYKAWLKTKFKGYKIAPVPSDENSDKIRGFNHVQEIFKMLDLPIINCLYKKRNYKQADLTKEVRMKVSENLGIKNLESLKGKKILLVDDVCTTGSTLKACIQLIKKAHPRKINFLVIAKVMNNDSKNNPDKSKYAI